MIYFDKESWKLDKYDIWLEVNKEEIEKFHLKEFTLDALRIGLPKSAAPFLGFSSQNGILHLETLNDHFSFDEDGADHFIVFGSDGGGNPICRDTTDEDKIILFDHDNDFEIEVINKNLDHFQICLLLYKNFIENIHQKYGSDGYSDNKYSIEDVEELAGEFREVDDKLLHYSSFWKNELELLIAHCES